MATGTGAGAAVTGGVTAEAVKASGSAGWGEGDRLQLGVVSVSHTVQHLYSGALAIAYPYVVVTYHISYGTLGIMLGVAGVVGGLLQGAAGLVERVSSRLLLAFQDIGLAICILLGAVVPGFAAFASARCAGAVVTWAQHPIGNSLLVRRFPHRRAFVLSCHTAGGSVGTAIAPIITAALIASYGWRVGIGVFALPLALGGLFVFFTLDDGRARRVGLRRSTRPGAVPAGVAGAAGGGASDGEASDGEASDGEASARETGAGHVPPPTLRLRDVATRRQVVGALAAGTVAAAGRGLGALSAYVPAYLKTGLHLHPITVGVLFTVLVTGSIIGPIAAGHVADRLGRSSVLAAVYGIGAFAMAAFVLVGHDVVAIAAVGLVLGVFAYSESPLLQAVFSDGVEGAPVRRAFGLFFAISYGVGALWLPLIGRVIDAVGFRAAFFVMGGSFAAASLIVLTTVKRGVAVHRP
ncbi:MAG: MFS transporter [Acidimicrobiales bacterium]